MKAIILAAGEGQRLRPLTDSLPKPLLPIAGKPILGTLLECLGQAGVSEVAIVIHHLGEKIRAFAGDGRAFGLNVTYVEQCNPAGTGHAVMSAIDFFDDSVVVMAGDTAFEAAHIVGTMDLFHDRGADVALCLKRLTPDRLRQTSSVRLEANGRITEFVEKPGAGEAPSDLASALLHVYGPAVLNYLRELPVSPRGEYELTAVIGAMIDDGLYVVGREFQTPPDLTSVEDLLRLNFGYAERLLDNAPDSLAKERGKAVGE